MQKLKLLQNLHLPDKESINFLISGITSPKLREMASLLNTDSIDDFLEHMHKLTVAYGDMNRRSPPSVKKFDKDKSKGFSSANGKLSSSDSTKDSSCVYCRTKGHVRADCFRLKRKEQTKQTSSPSSSATVAAVEDPPAPDSTVALINNHKLEISDPVLKVTKINDVICELKSLLDFGSPVSFVHPAVIDKLMPKQMQLIKQFVHLKPSMALQFQLSDLLLLRFN